MAKKSDPDPIPILVEPPTPTKSEKKEITIPKLRFEEMKEDPVVISDGESTLSSGGTPKHQPTASLDGIAKMSQLYGSGKDFMSRNQSMLFQKVHSKHIKKQSNVDIQIPVVGKSTKNVDTIVEVGVTPPEERIEADEILTTRLEILQRE